MEPGSEEGSMGGGVAAREVLWRHGKGSRRPAVEVKRGWRTGKEYGAIKGKHEQ